MGVVQALLEKPMETSLAMFRVEMTDYPRNPPID